MRSVRPPDQGAAGAIGSFVMRAGFAAALFAAASALSAGGANAGSCKDDIYKAEVEIGKRLDAIAARGKTGAQSTFATTHHQPTPSTVAGAEEKVGDLSPAEVDAVHQWMAEAHKADAAGDSAGCEKALTQARGLLGQ
jgi:hypothetical protein